MIEILAENLEKAIEELDIQARKTYQGEDYQIWEMNETEHEKFCDISEDDWKEDYGMWRSSEGSIMSLHDLTEFVINDRKILAWDGAGRIESLEEVGGDENHDDYCYGERKYITLLEYLCEEIGASQPGNVCALAVDLAKYNNISMAELFRKYQG